MGKRADRIDWSQVWYPGPTRVFTPQELALAAGDRPGPTVAAVAMFNCLLAGSVLLQLAPPGATAALTLLLAAAALVGIWGARRLWRQPSRRMLTWTSLAGSVTIAAAMILAIEWHALPRGSQARDWVRAVGAGVAILVALGWWFLSLYRAHQIEARLREQAEQQRALDMARQLAAAQIQPHFLYNALAALQHWVQAKDDRAAPMLAALTGFLRATLPLFNRERLALGDEAEAVRQYLAVMALRLGERLRWSVDVDGAAARAAVPPGLLLTLVENAIEHGVQPALSGAEVRVRAAAHEGRLTLTVRDTGPGLPPPAGGPDASATSQGAPAGPGVGLANSRARLAQAFGERATLQLDNADGGGCLATIDMPLEETPDR